MRKHVYYNVRNLVIIATNIKTNVPQEVSLMVTGHEAHKYINQEYGLNKTMPCGKGLYGEFKDIKITSKRL